MDSYKSYRIDCAPSYLTNNLTQSEDYLFFIHNSESQPRIMKINKEIFNSSSSGNVSIFTTNETSEMLFCKCIKLNNINYLAVGLYGGFKLWSIDGARLLFQIPAKNKIEGKIYAFVSICEFKMDVNIIYPFII